MVLLRTSAYLPRPDQRLGQEVNIIANMAAFVAMVWLSVELFTDISQPALGFVVLFLAFLFIFHLMLDAPVDWHMLTGGKHPDFDD